MSRVTPHARLWIRAALALQRLAGWMLARAAHDDAWQPPAEPPSAGPPPHWLDIVRRRAPGFELGTVPRRVAFRPAPGRGATATLAHDSGPAPRHVDALRAGLPGSPERPRDAALPIEAGGRAGERKQPEPAPAPPRLRILPAPLRSRTATASASSASAAAASAAAAGAAPRAAGAAGPLPPAPADRSIPAVEAAAPVPRAGGAEAPDVVSDVRDSPRHVPPGSGSADLVPQPPVWETRSIAERPAAVPASDAPRRLRPAAPPGDWHGPTHRGGAMPPPEHTAPREPPPDTRFERRSDDPDPWPELPQLEWPLWHDDPMTLLDQQNRRLRLRAEQAGSAWSALPS